MPRYFFNVHIGQTVVEDPEGQDFRDADQAWEATRAMVRDLMAVKVPQPVDWSSCHVEVRDDAGEIVWEFPFLEAVEWTGPMQ